MSRIEHLYRLHGPALLVYLRRLVGRGTAEDILQETFVQALRGRERMAEIISPRAWLFTIARNLGVSARRRRRPTVSLATEPPAACDDAADQARERLGRMRTAIVELPDKLRETLELRLRHELSYEEVAAVLKIPVGTVRSRLHNAVNLLRERLGPE